MSRVTNAIVTAHVGAQGQSDPEIDFVNRFLRESESGGGGEFIEVSRHAGGTKQMECRVYVSAFNHADAKTIIDAVNRAPWRDKEMVQLFIKEQEEELFHVRVNGLAQNWPKTVQLSRNELGIINNALNEVCNGVHLEGEFDTRMGCTVEEARALLAKIHALGRGED
jgi:hypothetical protein